MKNHGLISSIHSSGFGRVGGGFSTEVAAHSAKHSLQIRNAAARCCRKAMFVRGFSINESGYAC